MIVLYAGMKRINNELGYTQYELVLPGFEYFASFPVRDFFQYLERKGRKDSMIGFYAINHREKWQSSAMPVTIYENATAARFRTRMTRISRIYTDILHLFLSSFHSTDNKSQRSQRTKSRMGKLCALSMLCEGFKLFTPCLTRIYKYLRISASSAQSAFHRRLSALIMPKTCGFSTPRTRMPVGISGHALQRRDSGRYHMRLIFVSLSDRAQRIKGEI